MSDTTSSAAGASANAATKSRGTGFSIAVAIFGGIAGLVLLTGSTLSGVSAGLQSDREVRTAPVDGITEVQVSVGAADLTVQFGAVTDARLEVDSGTSSNRSWDLEVRGSTLVLEDARGGWFGFGWWGWDESRTATLTLPQSLAGKLDGQFDLSAGELNISGEYVNVALEVSAGALRFEGSAQHVTSTVSAGQSNITVDGAQTLAAEVSAGKSVILMTGAQPERVGGDVTAGSLELQVPRGAYDVQGDVAAGDRTIDVRTSPDAKSVIDIDLTAGDLTLRYS